mmetsp:Transcript_157650/g.278252  ORF Transcript_157650/g.278252 Transcript_157650/m.278252 type:complete len:210 (+) Transcript_157650:163-792(+)
MFSSCRVTQLLKRFELPPTATQAQLRAAYYKKAKVLHPDIAGPGSAEEFRKIKKEYEEAMKLLRGGGEAGGFGPDGAHGFRRPGEREQGPESSEWHGPQGEYWRANMFHEGKFKGRRVDFDPNQFRSGQRSHVRSDGQGGYYYEASGAGGTSRGAAHEHRSSSLNNGPTPAQRLRQVIVVSSGIFAGALWTFRTSRQTAARRGMPPAYS